jgi:thymidylate synthase (FAD)
MKPYAELLEFNQPNLHRVPGHTRISDQFPELHGKVSLETPQGATVIYSPERISEFAGRWDYGSSNAEKLGQESKSGGSIVKKWIASGEQSMLEMGHATFFVECSRVVSHELVRHRLLSFQQESQRFTGYEDLTYDDLYEPETGKGESNWGLDAAMYNSMKEYEKLVKAGVSKQIARYVLPNGFRTRMVISGNVREWRHVIRLRLHPSAQPEMRELMQQIYDQLLPIFPQSLEGITEEGRGIR